MKTAISIPDDTFTKAEKAAKKLGLSRSELYAMAVEHFIEPLLSDEITKTLDKLYSKEPSGLNKTVEKMQAFSFMEDEW